MARVPHISSWMQVPWAFALLLLIALAAPLYAEDAPPSDKPQPSVPTSVSLPPAPLSASERAAILADKELENKTKFIPSRYLLRNAPTTRTDPTLDAKDLAQRRAINHLSTRINRNMKSIDNNIRDMRTTIYRMRSIQRRRF